ncbi:hypothetical protein Tco_0988897 [Tanacetum coccineum]|uniref:Uncharacterized protein n=1 Tax=Tanacetum coccineum TaxID=301880 RepID=A0ABQ5ESP0_9ASTR
MPKLPSRHGKLFLHKGATSMRKISVSFEVLAVITAQQSSLGREMKKLSEQMHSVRVSCELCYGSHLSKDLSNKEQVKEFGEIYYGEFYQRPYPNKMGYQEKRSSLEAKLNMFMAESTKRDKESTDFIMKIKASTQAAIRNNEASLKAMEIRIGQIVQIVRERISGTLPSSTQTNLRDHVKAIASIEETQTNPNITSTLFHFVSFLCRAVERKSVYQDADVLTNLGKLKVNIPHVEALKKMPEYSRHLKELLKNKSRIYDDENRKMNE